MFSPKSKVLSSQKHSEYNLPNIKSIRKNQAQTQKPFIQNSTLKMKTIDPVSKSKSTYINTIKDLTGNIEYDEMDVKKVGQEQKRLKGILRKINSDTIKLIEDISPR